jgi:hypothetical protein
MLEGRQTKYKTICTKAFHSFPVVLFFSSCHLIKNKGEKKKKFHLCIAGENCLNFFIFHKNEIFIHEQWEFFTTTFSYV